MGVKLAELIPRKEISLDDLAGKVIAIDFSNAVYQFLSSIRQQDGTPLMDSKGRITSHLQGILLRTTNLMQRGIKICYVFDGKPPLLKIKEQEEREYRKQIAEEKLKKAMEEEREEEILKYSKQTVRLSKEIIEESKELIKALGLPVIQAPSEAEAMAAYMTEKEDAYAVASSDNDCLMFGATRQVVNLTLARKRRLASGATIDIRPELIELKEVLKYLDINQDQLIVLGILIGTDFNREGVKGVGPKTALKLVKQYKDFDTLFKEVKAEFDWKQIYAIFKSMPIMKNYPLKWKPIDEKEVLKLLVDEHEFSEERVLKTLQRVNKDLKKKAQTGLGKWV